MRWLAAALAVLLLSPGVAAAATQRTSLNAVESEVMCVSCGVPLAIADSPQADAERAEIIEQVKQGKTKQEILDNLVDTYGDRVLASPKDNGFGLAAYLIPIAVVLLVLVAGAIALPRWKNRPRAESQEDDAPRLSSEDADRLDADLANYKL